MQQYLELLQKNALDCFYNFNINQSRPCASLPLTDFLEHENMKLPMFLLNHRKDIGAPIHTIYQLEAFLVELIKYDEEKENEKKKYWVARYRDLFLVFDYNFKFLVGHLLTHGLKIAGTGIGIGAAKILLSSENFLMKNGVAYF